MVVTDIFVFGTTNDGFEIYPVTYHREYASLLDLYRGQSFIKQLKTKDGKVIIQYQVGNLLSNKNRQGHQFGFGLICEKCKIDHNKFQESTRYLDGVYKKAFVDHLGLVKSKKYQYRRFSEVPNLDAVLDNILSTINGNPPDLFTSVKGLTSEYISAPLEDSVKNESSQSKAIPEVTEQLREDAKKQKQQPSMQRRWRDIFLVASILLSSFALFKVWELQKQVEGMKKSIGQVTQKNNTVSKGTTNSLIREELKDGKRQGYFDHKKIPKSDLLSKQVINIDNFVNTLIKETKTEKEIQKPFILENNTNDLEKVAKKLETSSDLTFQEAFKELSNAGILMYQDN